VLLEGVGDAGGGEEGGGTSPRGEGRRREGRKEGQGWELGEESIEGVPVSSSPALLLSSWTFPIDIISFSQTRQVQRGIDLLVESV